MVYIQNEILLIKKEMKSCCLHQNGTGCPYVKWSESKYKKTKVSYDLAHLLKLRKSISWKQQSEIVFSRHWKGQGNRKKLKGTKTELGGISSGFL